MAGWLLAGQPRGGGRADGGAECVVGGFAGGQFGEQRLAAGRLGAVDAVGFGHDRVEQAGRGVEAGGCGCGVERGEDVFEQARRRLEGRLRADQRGERAGAGNEALFGGAHVARSSSVRRWRKA